MIAPQPFFRARGTPFSVLHRIRALLTLGHRVDLVTYPFGDPISLDGLEIIRSPKPPLVNDVKIGPSLGKVLLDIPLYFTARKQLQRKAYDIIHSHEEAAFFSVSLARKHGIKHIYDMHSSLPQQLGNFESFDIAPLRMLFQRLERYVLKTCDGVITICGDLGKTVEQLGVSVPHSMIENTADDSEIFRPDEVNVAEKFSIKGKKVVLYTGTFETYQGLDLLLEAFASVSNKRKDVHLLLVGGRSEQIHELKRDAANLNIGDSVSFSGTVPPSQIPSFLKAADVIVSPRSSGTNTPLKIYGYMKSGIPIVATDKYTHTQTLDSNTAHLVPATPAGLAEGILKVLDDKNYSRALAVAASTKANEKYSDQAYLRRVADFYARVLSTGDSSTREHSSNTVTNVQRQ
jgi:glycosyltransferase involved in cell wall biosynthesis